MKIASYYFEAVLNSRYQKNLSGFNAESFHHVWKGFHEREHAAELADIANIQQQVDGS